MLFSCLFRPHINVKTKLKKWKERLNIEEIRKRKKMIRKKKENTDMLSHM